MRQVAIGDRQASVIGLGCWQFGAPEMGWGDDFGLRAAHEIVERALELGVNFFDTAEIYSNGRSEEILGAVLEGSRGSAVIATKVSPAHGTRKGVVQAAERSLARLRTDRIDLYQLHWPNRLIPLSWTMRGMLDLVEAGKAGSVGVSNFGLKAWQRAEKALGKAVATNQVHFNLLERGPTEDLLPFAREKGRVIIAYSPLAQGVLGARYSESAPPVDFRANRALFSGPNLRAVAPLLAELDAVARGYEATPAQIALAWLVHQPGVVAIPGARNVAQLEANAAAGEIPLSGSEWQRLREAAAGIELSLPSSPLRAVARRVLGW